jgi:predicted TIM-barrel fold metal-dependent hydrolase
MRSTAPAYADTLVLAQALVRAAPERLVWGSDWPHTTAAPGTVNDADLVDLLRACRRTRPWTASSWTTRRGSGF